MGNYQRRQPQPDDPQIAIANARQPGALRRSTEQVRSQQSQKRLAKDNIESPNGHARKQAGGQQGCQGLTDLGVLPGATQLGGNHGTTLGQGRVAKYHQEIQLQADSQRCDGLLTELTHHQVVHHAGELKQIELDNDGPGQGHQPLAHGA